MAVSMHDLSVEVFVPMLGNLAGLLRKGRAHAEEKKFEPEVLLHARLAPDMFPLLRQVQLACDFAKNTTARLAGQEPPKVPHEEQSIEDLLTRIARTIDFVKAVPPGAFEGAEDRDISVPLRDRTLQMKGLEYLRRFGLPNFLFHMSTAYDILRHNGVQIGKADFIGSL